jgi:hypothetical protein
MIIIMEDSANGSKSTEQRKDESNKQANSNRIHNPKLFFYQKKQSTSNESENHL